MLYTVIDVFLNVRTLMSESQHQGLSSCSIYRLGEGDIKIDATITHDPPNWAPCELVFQQ
jgi:hypothetical protein